MQTSSSIRILLVEDHALVREGLTLLLNRERQLHVVAEAANGQEAVEQYRVHQPDLAIMDVSMPILDGIEATRRICQEFPHAAILIFTLHDDEATLAAAQQAGAKGHLFKDAFRKELLSAIRQVSKSDPAEETGQGFTPDRF